MRKLLAVAFYFSIASSAVAQSLSPVGPNIPPPVSTANGGLGQANSPGTAFTLPAVNDTLAGLATAQTFTKAQAINVTAVGVVSANGLTITNTTPAAVGAQQWSPRLHFTGQGWGTGAGASQTVDCIQELQTVQGTVATGNLVISCQANGGGYTAVGTIPVASSGRWIIPGGFDARSVNSFFGAVYVGSSQTASFASSTDGMMFLQNNAGTGFSRLQFGGTSSSFAALQTATTVITAGLADGTAGGTFNASGALKNTGISTDSTHTDATVCEDTTSHQFYFGSGTLGVCLGTSSMRFKHDIAALTPGLDAIMALEPISYRLNADHGDPNKLLYGFTAEQGGQVLPALMTKDAEGRPNTFDYLGVVPVLVKAVQDQQAEIEALRDEVHELKRMNATLTSLH